MKRAEHPLYLTMMVLSILINGVHYRLLLVLQGFGSPLSGNYLYGGNFQAGCKVKDSVVVMHMPLVTSVEEIFTISGNEYIQIHLVND